MKLQFVNRHALKAITAATAILLIAGNPVNSFAGPIMEKKISPLSEDQVNVQYAGSDETSFIFHVNFDNPAAQKFSLVIKNDDGIVVYENQFSDVHFNKTVRVIKEGTDIHPTFIIRTANREIKRSFSVNTKYTEDVEVTKL
ncbi:MAG TPA: hypothetical protein VMH01_09900 [Puia sp.]|nr:hypothetical protein [Puia sp.]